MPNLRDVARLAGVSVSVASRALNPHPDANARVAPATRKRVAGAAARLGYRPDRVAEFLRRGTVAAVSAFVARSSNRLHADLVIGLAAAAAEQGFALNLCFGLTLASFRRFVEPGSGRPHSGVITYPYEHAGPGIARAIERYRQNGGKVLLLQPRFAAGGIPAVSIDEEKGGRLVAARLLERGCERFYTYGYYPRRIEAFEAAVEAAGSRVRRLPGNAAGLAALKRAARHWRRVGIFAAADHFALDIYRAFASRPRLIGRGLLVVGYDDMVLMDQVCPPLTTVHQPTRRLGRRAVEKVVGMIYGGREESELIAPRLVVRASA